MQIISAGDRFGILTILELAGRSSDGHKTWKCACACGSITVKQSNNLKSGSSKSCGCLAIEATRAAKITHGMRRSREYSSWSAAKDRCKNPLSKDYKRYGGRGIEMSQEWVDSFETFFRDMGERPKGCSLERNDTNGPYSKENCTWATPVEQARNRRNSIYVEWMGSQVHLSKVAEEIGISYGAAYQRLKRGKLHANNF